MLEVRHEKWGVRHYTVLPKDDLLKGISFVRHMIADWIGEHPIEADDGVVDYYMLWDKFFDDYFTK